MSAVRRIITKRLCFLHARCEALLTRALPGDGFSNTRQLTLGISHISWGIRTATWAVCPAFSTPAKPYNNLGEALLMSTRLLRVRCRLQRDNYLQISTGPAFPLGVQELALGRAVMGKAFSISRA